MATVNGGDAAEVIHRAGDGVAVPPGYVDVVGVTALADVIDAGGGHDIVHGDAGNDSITGGVGADTLYGGEGDDWFVIGAAAQVAAGEVMDGGAGVNALQLTSAVSGGVLDLGAATLTNVTRLVATTLTAPTTVRMSSAQLASLTQIDGTAPTVFGEPPRLTIALDDLADISLTNLLYRFVAVAGGASADDIAVSGNFQGFALQGGEGDDRLSVDALAGSFNSFTIDGGAGDDEISVLPRAGLISSSSLLRGGEGDDVIRGNDRSGTFIGGLGADTLYGGVDDDTFVILDAASIDGLAEVISGGPGPAGFFADTISFQVGTGPAEFDLRFVTFDDVEIFRSFVPDTGQHTFDMMTSQVVEFLGISGGGARIRLDSDLIIGPQEKSMSNVHFVMSDDDSKFVLDQISIDNLTVSGGAGDDYLRLKHDIDFYKNNELVLFGDAGNDRLQVRYGEASLYGGQGDDKLTSHERFDILDGGSGDDILIGEGNPDTLTGGAGSDRFVFRVVEHSMRHNDKYDRILDFSVEEGDLIDIRGMDADETVAGDQAFFLADGFTGVAGQVVQFSDGLGNTLIEGDTNGNGKSDFKILLVGEHVLTESNFLF